MKLKDHFFYTIREDIKDEESQSGKLMVRSGMLKKTSNGVYMYMPLGLLVLKKIEKIIREEMNKIGAQELLMPSLLPEETYIQSGRRAIFGDNMFTLKDRYERSYALGPTHEEFFTLAAKEQIRSYKDMPFTLYQIGDKFRDETRPRFGLIRVREFFMKDAYSFDKDLEGLDVSYQKMFQAYQNIFDRIGVKYRIVRADTGAMGGLLSEEFQAITPIGEDTIVLCEHCNYASNIEVSECVKKECATMEALFPKELVHTPHAGSIEEVTCFLGMPKEQFVKTLIYKANDTFYACLVPGDREVNEVKVAKLLQVNEVMLASPIEVEKVTHAKVGYAGPIGLEIPIIMDQDIRVMHNFVVGANQTDYHYRNVNVNDFSVTYEADIKNVKEKDPCPNCSHPLIFTKGIEVGNIFKLGTKYAEALDLSFLDSENQRQYAQMGCYGIGLGRIMASVAEQKADENGIAWPLSIAPYQIGIVLISDKDALQVRIANEIYDHLCALGYDVLLDDRSERPGVKFKDMDLIGLPIRITVGSSILDGKIEMKKRSDEKPILCDVEELDCKLKEWISE